MAALSENPPRAIVRRDKAWRFTIDATVSSTAFFDSGGGLAGASVIWRAEMGAGPKITFIGAGSTVFARNLLRDLFMFPELHDARSR